jgi:hypothetical protein
MPEKDFILINSTFIYTPLARSKKKIMKKKLLLFVLCFTAFYSNAQLGSGARTTVGGARWYDYCSDLLQPYQVYYGKDVNFVAGRIWNDTSAIYGDIVTSGLVYTRDSILSIGIGVDPFYPPWNNTSALSPFPVFTGSPGITLSDSYFIDSVRIPGWYNRTYSSPAKVAVIDTLIIAFVQAPVTGPGTSDLPVAVTTTCASYYGVSALYYNELFRDLTYNIAAHNGGSPLSYISSAVYKILLTNVDSCGSGYTAPLITYPRVGHTDPVINFAVVAGNMYAMSVTYKSGDATYPYGDTVRYSSGTAFTGLKYHYWQPEYGYAVATPGGTAPDWPLYDSANHGCGYFAHVGFGYPSAPTLYYSNWEIFSGTSPTLSPTVEQYPHFGYHAVCPSCSILTPLFLTAVNDLSPLSNIRIEPNPANDRVAISYDAVTGTTVHCTLTNILGQTVATQQTYYGKAVFNTSNLPNGIYIYNIDANGRRSTGKVVINH